jgi:hypothetical protein
MPKIRAIASYFNDMMPLAPIPETGKKIYFYKRYSPALAARGTLIPICAKKANFPL